MLRAGVCGGDGWKQLAEGDVVGALRVARGQQGQNVDVALLEAEALIAAGAIVAGLERLDALYRRGNAAGTLALARRLHFLGNHIGAERVAEALPMHAQAALTGARAAFAGDRFAAAFRFIEPFLNGMAFLPESAVAGAVAVIASSIMARGGQFARLQYFARHLIEANDLPEDMMPMVARTAWAAGFAVQAWDRYGDENSPLMVAARLELALLAGNAALASQLLKRVGPIGAPSVAAVFLLQGGFEQPVRGAEVTQTFGEGVVVHIWRTHPHRWQPWIDAALQTPADVAVFNLAENELPDVETIPQSVVDDGSLIEFISPVPVPARPVHGSGVWVERPLCYGIGVGHDWPEDETRFVEEGVSLASSYDSAAVRVLSAEAALAHVHEGCPMVIVAPPGDPFWAGPFPERAWPALRIVRADPRTGWQGAGARVVEQVNELLAAPG